MPQRGSISSFQKAIALVEDGGKFGPMPRFDTKIITSPRTRDELIDAEARWKSYYFGYN